MARNSGYIPSTFMIAATRKLCRMHLAIRHVKVHISHHLVTGDRIAHSGDHPRSNVSEPTDWSNWFISERIPAARVTRIMELLYG